MMIFLRLVSDGDGDCDCDDNGGDRYKLTAPMYRKQDCPVDEWGKVDNVSLQFKCPA